MFDAPWLRSELGQAQDVADKGSGAYLAGGLIDPIAQAAGSGAFAAASRMPGIPKVAEATSTYLKNIVAGGATGAGLSAAQGGSATEGGMFGAGITAAIGNPALAKAVSNMSGAARNVGNSLWATLSKGGRATIGQKMVLDNLQPAERDVVLKILSSQGADVSELGQPLTVAQTLGQARVGQQVKSPVGARLAALESDVSVRPGGEALNEVAAAQQGVERQMIESLTGASGKAARPLEGLSAADVGVGEMQAARGDVAKQLYPRGNVTGDERLNEILSRPAVRRAIGVEETIAGNAPRITQVGKDIPARIENAPVYTEWQQTPYSKDVPAKFADYPIKSLQEEYQQIDKTASAMAKAVARGDMSIDKAALRDLLSAKSALGAWLSEKSPAWATANKIFSFQSTPVTRAEVGRELGIKFDQSPTAFLKATEDLPAQQQMISQATGRAGKSLSDVFNLGQMSKISGLRNSAQIENEVKQLQSMAQANLGDERAFQLPNLLNVWVAIANKLARETAKSTVDDVTKEAARVLANPAELRRLLAQDAMKRSMVNRPISGAQMIPTVSGVSNVRGMMTGEQ